VNGTTSTLSALANDDGGEQALTYTWSTLGTPPAAVSLAPNASNAAKTTTATFGKAGVYALRVTATDRGGLSAFSDVNVTVNQTLSALSVAPPSAVVASNDTQQFTATATDQFGNPLAVPPSVAWSVSGGGALSNSGLFTAGANAGGPFVVSAAAGNVRGGASVSVTARSRSLTIGEPVVLSTADGGNANLMVAQAATLSEPASLQSLSFYVSAAVGTLRLGAYDASGPNGGPGRKLAETPELRPVVGWNTANVTPVNLSAGTYWLAYLASDNRLAFVKAPGTSNSKYFSYAYAAMPSTFATSPNTSGSHWSFYASLSTSAPADACAGVNCTTPPISECVNGTVLRRYGSPGTCNSGTCSYTATDVTCPFTCQAGACTGGAGGLPGPLKASANPNYFQDTNGQAVALFGSHTWNNLQDWGTNGAPQAFDFTAYTSFLSAHGQNFTMLWRTELPKFCNLPTMAAGSPDVTVSSQPWPRSGPGQASDGGLKFDLGRFDQPYFDRLRARVSELNRAGVWVGVYLFTGEWLMAFRCATDGYPFTGGNNVNAIDDGGGVGSMSMTSPNAITTIQNAMVDKTIDTLNDLPNVLWIVSEEAPLSSTWWHQQMIAHVHSYESTKPLQHPVGFASLDDGSLDKLVVDSNADWVALATRVSPASTCGNGAPACKVNINDSDHTYFGMWNDSKQANRQYAWQNFARGNQVAFMDPYNLYYPREGRNSCPSPNNGVCSSPDARWDNFRDNLGYLVGYSRRMNLIAARARSELSSTGYCLGQTPAVGTELLVYAPSGGAFSVNLSSAAGRTLSFEWFDPSNGKVVSTGSMAGGNASQSFTTPAAIAADGVLYLVDAAGHG
jgi:hypothetical protein